jgi:hypothetical protein
MPWRVELEAEELKRQKKDKQTAKEKQQSLQQWVKGKDPKQRPEEPSVPQSVTKEEEKYQQQCIWGDLDENSPDFHKLQKVIKVKEVQRVKLGDLTSNVQAILINPKWRPCDHFEKLVRLKQLGTPTEGTPGEESAGEEASGEEKEDEEGTSRAFKGISMKEFKQLVIPKQVMTDGILFIWVEKEYIMDVVRFLEDQEFYYVENMCWVMLDETMREGTYCSLLTTTYRGREAPHAGRDSCLRPRRLHLPPQEQEDPHDVPPHQQQGRRHQRFSQA